MDLLQAQYNGRGKFDALQVAKASDFGVNDRLLTAKTHLGHILYVGDTVLGYDLMTAQLADADLDRHLEKGNSLPDVVLVRPLSFVLLLPAMIGTCLIVIW